MLFTNSLGFIKMKPTLLLTTILYIPTLTTASVITNFDTPPVIDLSSQLQKMRHSSRSIPIQAFPPKSDTRIFHKSDSKLTLDPPFELPTEALSVAPNVQRVGKTLFIKTSTGTLQFKNWRIIKGDGDSSTFVYRGIVAGSPLQRVDMYMGQDAPGSMLINNINGKVYFLHSGDHPVAVSPDGAFVLEVTTGDWRLQLVSLASTKPKTEIFCTANSEGSIETEIHSWSQPPANGFDLIIKINQQNLPIRFTRTTNSWRINSSQSVLLEKLGVRCSMPS